MSDFNNHHVGTPCEKCYHTLFYSWTYPKFIKKLCKNCNHVENEFKKVIIRTLKRNQ